MGRSMVLRYYQEESLTAEENHNDGAGILVIPTGAGKSLIQAKLIEKYSKLGRVLCLTHSKELVEQNKEEYGGLNAGFYSASICKKGFNEPVVFASIQTLHKNAIKFYPAPVITIIDECHLISHEENTMYRQTLEVLLNKNPKMKIIGLTATPFRLKMGYLHEMPNKLFNSIIYEAKIDDLIKQGYLCNLLTYGSNINLAVEQLEVSNTGDYTAESMNTVYLGNNTINALMHVIEKGEYRRKWLIFASTLAHCQEIQTFLNKQGIACESITNNTPKVKRKAIITEFKKTDSTIRCIVNKDILTTGFNAPDIDMVVMLRPTKSASLYVQMVGRGMRISEGKDNCLVLDYGFNIERHGPLNNLNIPSYRARKTLSAPPCKTCPKCFWLTLASDKVCPECGYEYPMADVDDKLAKEHSTDAIIEIPNQVIKKRVLSAKVVQRTLDKLQIIIECEDTSYADNLVFKAYEQYYVAMNSAILKKFKLDTKWEMIDVLKYFKNDYEFVYIQNKQIIKLDLVKNPNIQINCNDCRFNINNVCTPRNKAIPNVERADCAIWRIKK